MYEQDWLDDEFDNLKAFATYATLLSCQERKQLGVAAP